MSGNDSTRFETPRGNVSPGGWETRVDLAACYRLIDKFGMLCRLERSCRAQVHAMAARTEPAPPPDDVLQHTAHMYQPRTRRPYGALEWHALLRLLDAGERSSGYPSYRH